MKDVSRISFPDLSGRSAGVEVYYTSLGSDPFVGIIGKFFYTPETGEMGVDSTQGTFSVNVDDLMEDPRFVSRDRLLIRVDRNLHAEIVF